MLRCLWARDGAAITLTMEPLSRTFDKDADDEAAGPRTELLPFLFVALECSRPLAGGMRVALAELDEITVGRGSKRSFVRSGRSAHLSLPDKLVSSRHARFQRKNEQWFFEDLESRNGSRLDGELISRIDLPARAVLELGGTFLIFHEALPCPVGWPGDLELGIECASGTSTLLPAYENSLNNLERIAASTLPILLLGESGAGKEVLAKAVHLASGRTGQLVAVNCGALPASLVEGQLFGHAKGAFSGALKDEPGLIRASDRGTLFLDEIGELPLAAQTTLLRVLQECEVLPVGATKPVRVDLRVVAATHKRIDQLPNVFRPDLYARLAGFSVRLLPLRARREDLGLLLSALLRSLAGERAARLTLSPPLGRALLGYVWPLNIRELVQALSTALVLLPAQETVLDVMHVPQAVRRVVLPNDAPESIAALTAPGPRAQRSVTPDTRSTQPAISPPAERPGWGSATRRGENNDALREELLRQLRTQRGNISEVARLMGRTRMQIHRWMKKFAIDPETFREG